MSFRSTPTNSWLPFFVFRTVHQSFLRTKRFFFCLCQLISDQVESRLALFSKKKTEVESRLQPDFNA